MSESRKDKLLQNRTDALTAEYVYSKKLGEIAWVTNTITCLAIFVPIITTFALVLAEGTEYAVYLNTFSFCSSCVLLCLSVGALIFRLEQKKESYLISRRSNIFIANEAEALINDESQDPTWFFKFVAEQDARDRENIAHIKEGLSQDAYRYTLKRLYPSNSKVVCRVCGANPYIFKAGSCQLCGNSPIKEGNDHV